MRTIVALGGGGWMMEPDNPLLDDFVLERTGAEHPRIALLPTASRDHDNVVARFYDAFARKAVAHHLPLFQRDRDPRLLLDQDAIYVSGGNTANALAVWRVHGVDRLLREAWARGVVLAGVSAGALCWFEDGLTDSFGVQMEPLGDGLGLLSGSLAPHYDPRPGAAHGEAARAPRYAELIQTGRLVPGIALSDGAAAVYEDRSRREIVTSRAEAAAWRLDEAGHAHPLPVRFLGG